MAEKYLEHGKYPAYAAIPAWGVAQDGDGAVNGLAVPAIASIAFNGFDNTTGAISIMGVSCTFTFGTSADAQANSLAAGINAKTTAVNAGTTPNGTQLRDLVYARGPSAGAPAGTCQIMTRAGSTTLNHAENSNVAITHSLNGTAPTIIQFAGGVSGSWGYFQNTAIMWPSAKAVGSYGFMWAKPLCGDATAGDTVNVRTTLNGNPISIDSQLLGNPPGMRSFGTSAMLRMLFNAGEVWPETNGRLTMRFSAGTSYLAVVFTSAYTTLGSGRGMGNRFFQGGICSTDGEPNFGFELFPTQYNSTIQFSTVAPKDRYENVFFACGSRTGNEALSSYPLPVLTVSDGVPCPTPTQYAATFDRCTFILKQANGGVSVGYAASSNMSMKMLSCKMRGIGVSSVTSGMISMAGYMSTPAQVVVRNMTTEGIPANTKLIIPPPYLATGELIVEDSSLENMEATQGTIIDATGSFSPAFDFSASSSGTAFPFILENLLRSVYWLPTKGQPTLNAQTPDNYPMSWAVQLSTNAELIGPSAPISIPRMGYLNQSADGARTLSVNFLADKARAITTDHVYMVVNYTDAATGAQKSQSTRLRVPQAHAEVMSLDPDWSQTKNDGTGSILPYMTIGADRFYRRYALSLTTATAIKQGTSVLIQIYIELPNATNTDRFIFCPEVIAV